MTDSPMRIGVLGASRIAEVAITEAAEKTGDVLAGVAARDPQRAADYAKRYGYERAYASYAELIADDTLDLVYIGLANAFHAEWTIAAVEAGRSVLVEKPFASNLAEFDRVAESMRRSPGWAWEAFHHAHHPVMKRFLEVLGSGEIGDVENIRIRTRMPPPGAGDPRWNFDLAGGALMDVGCYALHAMNAMGDVLGAPAQLVSASMTPADEDSRVDAETRAEYRLGRAGVSIDASMLKESPDDGRDPFDFSLLAEGTRGSLRTPAFVRPFIDGRVFVTVDGEERVEDQGTVSSYKYQLEHVRALVRAGDRSEEELARSRRVAAQIDEAYTAGGLPLRPFFRRAS